MEPMVVMASKAAEAAGADLLKAHQNRYKMQLTPSLKGEHGIEGWVTHVDQFLDRKIVEMLSKSYPSHSFLSEEGGLVEGSDPDWCWIIDPLDGTTNFIAGIPHFCISIAVQYKNVTQHAVVYDPVRDEMFAASRGRGMVLNQHKCRLSAKTTLQHTVAMVGRAYSVVADGKVSTFYAEHYQGVMALAEAGVNMRRSGSAALDLAYVAAGRVDFFVELGLKPWDIAAGELLVKEAAGAVVDLQGGYDTLQTGCVLACHASLAKPVLTLLMPSWGKVYKNVLAL